MRKQILLLAAVIMGLTAMSQNPATVFTIPNRTVILPCGTGCTSLSVAVPHIKQTNNYVVTNPAYVPFGYTTPAGTVASSIYVDDTWSAEIPFPFAFSFCFFGTNYPKLLMGSNSAITFDVSRAGTGSGYAINATSGAIPNTTYAPSMIFGPYHDIDPSLASTNKKIEYRIEGVAPKRRFIASYNDMPYFGTNCTTERATHQMVLYENTGIIEVYIKDKPYCTSWNSGLTILGIQDDTRTKAVAAAGKNATVWGNTAMDSCFRFIPSGGASTFKRAELLVNNVIVATNTTDTSSGAAGVLNVNFPNRCPTADSTAYAIKVVYGSCSNPAIEVSFVDTIFVKKNTLAATVTKTDATCFVNGSVTVAATGGVAPVQYSINGGAYQTSNVFSNLQPGSYTVTTRDAVACSVISQPLSIALQGAITVNAGADTTLCLGASFLRNVVGTGTTYSWSPATGISSTAVGNPVTITPTGIGSVTYTVTATTGNCTAQDVVVVTAAPGATASAGADAIILSGQTYQLLGSGSAGSYVWTPTTGLSTSTILTPNASPAQTTTYTLKITTPQGCTATDDMTLTVVPYCIKPMEAFTPNGDGVNEFWLITNGTGCLKSAKAQVFNRYGAKVFESNDYKNNWNGTYDGKPLPDGTYYFVITYQLITGQVEYLKGNVTILR